MNAHAARVVIWLIMSAAGCLAFWLFYRRELNRTYDLLRKARDRFHDAGGNAFLLSQAIGNKMECSIDLLEAKDHLDRHQREMDSLIRQRRNCMLATPGVIAIVILIYV